MSSNKPSAKPVPPLTAAPISAFQREWEDQQHAETALAIKTEALRLAQGSLPHEPTEHIIARASAYESFLKTSP